jgi:UDP-glucose 4-epimerase
VKVFVTGGAGYIDSVAVEELLDRGDGVHVFDNLTEGHREAVDSRATFIRGDLNDSKSISLAIQTSAPDAVMHYAANALVGESMRDPFKYFQNNVGGGLNLLRAMVENKVSWKPEFQRIGAIVESAWNWHKKYPRGYPD